ncbi:MAG: hypothetical protein ABI416_16825 [Ginsengibacter sp.]
MAKIMSLFPKQNPLTRLMILALRLACKKQLLNEPFGQIDLEGSFAGLLRRDFIEAKTIVYNKETHVSWFVTRLGKLALIELGYNDGC